MVLLLIRNKRPGQIGQQDESFLTLGGGMTGMSEPSILSLQDAAVPVTYGSLLQFSDDPIACMRRLHREHGDLAVLADGDQKLVFVFSPDLNRQVLSDTQVLNRGSLRFAAAATRPNDE